MGLELSNPKRFLPLLLFIGFVFTLVGKGWLALGISSDPRMYDSGLAIMGLAVFLWVLDWVRKMFSAE